MNTEVEVGRGSHRALAAATSKEARPTARSHKTQISERNSCPAKSTKKSIYLSIYLSIYTYIHTYIHAYIHTYIHTVLFLMLFLLPSLHLLLLLLLHLQVRQASRPVPVSPGSCVSGSFRNGTCGFPSASAATTSARAARGLDLVWGGGGSRLHLGSLTMNRREKILQRCIQSAATASPYWPSEAPSKVAASVKVCK